MNRFFVVTCAVLFMAGCEVSEQTDGALFELLDPSQTGIDFTNQLKYDADFNVYTYRNYYNGGGVSIGDVNNDGLVDIYMTSNLDENKLFLNKGEMQFEDITAAAGVAGSMSWSTGVTMADVNGDGWLDIYVCNSGDIAGDKKVNELFINNQDMTFTESAASYGLDDGGYSTHASFFDYDKDGDLDVYVLNNSFQAIGSFDLRRNERPKRDSLGGDKLYRNDGEVYTDVSVEAGIYGSIIGFGLGVTVGDVNNDNWDDIYISNDFFERDYLYINQKNGTFREDLTNQVKSISAASMGADMADINNDGYNDIFVTDMLPNDPERMQTVTTFDSWDRYQYGVQNDYFHQFTRNTFQLNNTDGSFSEIGRLLGVDASDWSWGALIFDMNNDGNKDLFIANGIYQDLTNQDFLQYISNEEVAKSIILDNKVDYKKLIDIIPSNPVPNRAFMNKGSLIFEDVADDWGLDTEGFSNGSAYGDLDNDGDLDLVVNNVNMQSWVYRNNTVEQGMGNFLRFSLQGSGVNKNAIGTKIKVTSSDDAYYTHQQPTRGFQSSVDYRPLIGLKDQRPVDVEVTWPSGALSVLKDVEVNQELTLQEPVETKLIVTETEGSNEALFKLTESEKLNFEHKENLFVDFDRERLLYHMSSTESPKISSGDVNQDGTQDYYIGGSKGESGILFVSSEDSYLKVSDPFENEAGSEDMESVFFDADNDGDLDLYVCSGGTEFSSSSSSLKDRLYLNSGGDLELSNQMLPSPSGYVSSSSVTTVDFDQDGDQDLFVGERLVPFRYGESVSGYLLENDGEGIFSVREESGSLFEDIGMITDVASADLNGDGWYDLVVAGEYMPVLYFRNEQGSFQSPVSLTKNGWWNALSIKDVDGDGYVDIIAGNHGLNSRFKADEASEIVLFAEDFDKNGQIDPILTKQVQGGHRPYALRHNLIDQIKELKKLFPDYESYRNVTMEAIFDESVLSKANRQSVQQLSSVVLWNDGAAGFTEAELPREAQLAPIYAIELYDFDSDGDVDVVVGGNLHGAKPEVGRYDASYGLFLKNAGGRQWQNLVGNSGLKLEGEIRDFHVDQNRLFVLRNNQAMQIFEF